MEIISILYIIASSFSQIQRSRVYLSNPLIFQDSKNSNIGVHSEQNKSENLMKHSVELDNIQSKNSNVNQNVGFEKNEGIPELVV
jgi:hypothetical protein